MKKIKGLNNPGDYLCQTNNFYSAILWHFVMTFTFEGFLL